MMQNSNGSSSGNNDIVGLQRETHLSTGTTIKSPWNPGVFYAMSIIFGFGAAGVLAGINYRRLGKPELRWPTIIASVVVFVAYVVITMVFNVGQYAGIGYLINIPIAILLERLQRPHYNKWKEDVESAKGGGWGIPIGIGLAGIATAFIVAVIVGMASTAWTVHEAGPITHLEVGKKTTGTIEDGFDVDAFSFQANEGECYLIETSTPHTNDPLEDSMLTLWYSDGVTVLTWNDDYAGSRDSCIEWTAEATGIFYVTVENADMVSTGDYALLIQCISR